MIVHFDGGYSIFVEDKLTNVEACGQLAKGEGKLEIKITRSFKEEGLPHYDQYSMKILRDHAASTFQKSIQKVNKTLVKFKLTSAFLIWRAYIISRHRKKYPKKHLKINDGPSVTSCELHKYHFQRADFISKGAKIICRLLFHRLQKRLHTYFHNWRREIRCRMRILLHCWHLWTNSTAKSKLLRMTGRRFLIIASKPLMKVFRIISGEKKSEAWGRWVLCVQLLRSLEQQKLRLKLLFKCWKLTTVASIAGKKQLRKGRLLRGMKALEANCKSHSQYHERLQQRCVTEIVSARSLRRAISAWRIVQKRRSLILRALQRLVNTTLAISWHAWQQNIQTTPVEEGLPLPEDAVIFLPAESPDPIYPDPDPEPDSSHMAIGRGQGKDKGEVVKTYRRAVFQDGDSSVVYKTFALVRRAKRNTQQPLTNEPSQISQYKTTSRPVISSLSLEERMRARLASAHALRAEFDRRYSARHSNQSGKKNPLA